MWEKGFVAYEQRTFTLLFCRVFFFSFPPCNLDCPERLLEVGFVMRQLFSAGILYVGSNKGAWEQVGGTARAFCTLNRCSLKLKKHICGAIPGLFMI